MTDFVKLLQKLFGEVSMENENPNGNSEVKTNGDDKVAYETYKKAMETVAKRSEKLSELEKELENYRQKELEQQGKSQELIESLRKQKEERENELKKVQSNFALKTLKSSFSEVAREQGCVMPDKLLKLLDRDALNAVEIDDEFNINRNQLKEIVEKAKEENPFAFVKKEVNIVDGVPKAHEVRKPKTKSPKEMSREELEAELLKLQK